MLVYVRGEGQRKRRFAAQLQPLFPSQASKSSGLRTLFLKGLLKTM
jgi:hypothetical protein